MEPKELIERITKDLSELEGQGNKTVQIEALKNYMSALQNEADASNTWRTLQHQSNLEAYKAESASRLEMFKSVIASGQGALKASLLVNGGAAAAMLAFIGNVWSKDGQMDTAAPLACAIQYFSTGLLLAALASGGTYLVQFIYAESSGRKDFWWKVGHGVNALVILLVVASYILFAIGSFTASNTFASHLIN